MEKIPKPVLVEKKVDTCEIDRARLILMNPAAIEENFGFHPGYG